ncbi:MAG TPA: hypothetical protein DCM05_13240 [Elusimicrobia bacterium]|nr:hypothetical protein [Elusimicrobiota bacterium]
MLRRAVPLLAVLLLSAAGPRPSAPKRQTYPFIGYWGYKVDVPQGYTFTRAFRGRNHGTEVVVFIPREAKDAPMRLEAVRKNDDQFIDQEGSLELMRKAIQRSKGEKGEAFDFQAFSLPLPAFAVQTTRPSALFEVVVEGETLMYKFVAEKESALLQRFAASLVDQGAPKIDSKDLYATDRKPFQAVDRPISPQQEQAAMSSALMMQGEPRLGWKLAALAQFKRGPRRAAAYWPVFTPEGSVFRDETIAGVTYERGEDGTLAILNDGWEFKGDKRSVLVQELEGADFAVLNRKEGAALEELGPSVVRLLKRFREQVKNQRRDDAVKAVVDYSRLFTLDGQAFDEWMLRSLVYAAGGDLSLEYLGSKKAEDGGAAVLRFQQSFRGQKSPMKLTAKQRPGGLWAVATAER